jgi:hypothetical protein
MATTHTVVKGDTLWEIAKKYLGDGTKYKQLAAINNISNPDLIYVGQVIKLSSDGSSSNTTSANDNKPTVKQFGLQSNVDGVLFATWSWDKKNTASYKVLWTYDTGNGVWFVGSNSTINVDEDDPTVSRQSTYSVPGSAKRVKFKVKPISKTYTKNKTETHYWEAEWSTEELYADSTPLATPGIPSVEIDKYKLTATLENITVDALGIEFEIVKDNANTSFKTGKATIASAHASYSCTVDAGGEYKVRCRAYKGNDYSEWSQYSSNVSTIPATPAGITEIRASSKTSVYLEWSTTNAATTYDIEYATKKEHFDGSDQTTTKTGIEFTKYDVSGLESGTEYFFRVRASNSKGSSAWSDIKSVVIGKKPAAPTTWSSTTTAITGEALTLYWVHNSEDGSSQVYADLELYINGVKETHTIKNSTDEDEKDKTSSYTIDTSSYIEGTKIQWRVRTSGITNEYGDWSIQRSIDIYAPPTLEMRITDVNARNLDKITSFPFYISSVPGPNTQAPIGYHLVIASNEIYETTDNKGNQRTVNAGEQVYSKYFDTNESLLVEFSAGNIDLENNVEYTITCTVSMNSGLSVETSKVIGVAWTEVTYEPNAEIGIDEDTLTAYIRPYCIDREIATLKVLKSGESYTATRAKIYGVWGEIVPGAKTDTGELVYHGVNESGEDVYFCYSEVIVPLLNVLLSVYRREFDGRFVEIAHNLDSAKNTTVTDPHPALDYARYRIVATSKTTGSVSYYDTPGYPVGAKAAVIQWDEAWTNFETSEDEVLEQPPWSGSMLKLLYDIDVSDNNDPDVELVKYIGRENPVGYYGTQLGHSSDWSMKIEKNDKETLYALRRLQRWMGDVYVREPSGSGYWANIKVSFDQKHCELTIPVSLRITRVEGGV